MARVLRDKDYERALKSDAGLEQVVQENWEATKAVEQSAQAEMISYLAQRYNTSDAFSNTSEFDETEVYNAKDRVEYTADAFSATTVYNADDRVVHLEVIYRSIAGSVAHAFDADEWEVVCDDKTLFFVTLPQPEYDQYTTYAIGDKIWYQNKVYTNRAACINILPTESAFWGTGVTYTVTGVLPDDNTIWTQGDNRNQQLVMHLLDITLYHLYSSINPRNIPDLRKQRYNGDSPTDSGGAIGWLKSVAHGNVEADLPVIAPAQGLSMRSGNAASYNNPSTNMMW